MASKKVVPKISAPKPGDKISAARQYVLAHPSEAAHNQSALAKKMFKEVKGLFPSVESARYAVRSALGQLGKKSRNTKDVKIKALHIESKKDYRPNKGVVEGVAAKILVLDIETAPLKGYFWSMWKQNIAINQVTNDWFCFTWSAKWLFDDKVLSERLTPEEALKQDDKRIMKSLWKALDEADLVIAHNGKSFDIPKVNTRFLVHRMMPPSPYVIIDTLLTLRKEFGFASNKLDYVNRILGLARKLDTGGFELWDACYRGDGKALKKMEEYNIKDVKILEDLYFELRPWIRPHPPVSIHMLDGEVRCPSCGSKDMDVRENGKYVTQVNIFETLRCNNCGAVARKRKANKSVYKDNLLVSVAR